MLEPVGLNTCSFCKKRLQNRCFPVNIVKWLRIAFFRTTPVAAPDIVLEFSHDAQKMTFLRAFHSKCEQTGGIYQRTNLSITSSKLNLSSLSRAILTSRSNQIFCTTREHGVAASEE